MTNKEKKVVTIFLLFLIVMNIVLVLSIENKKGNDLNADISKQEEYINQLEKKDQELRIVYDSMLIENQKQRIKSDSLKKELTELKNSYNKIKSKYEKIHVIVNSMSIDESIQFISTAISKEDSIR